MTLVIIKMYGCLDNNKLITGALVTVVASDCINLTCTHTHTHTHTHKNTHTHTHTHTHNGRGFVARDLLQGQNPDIYGSIYPCAQGEAGLIVVVLDLLCQRTSHPWVVITACKVEICVQYCCQHAQNCTARTDLRKARSTPGDNFLRL